MKKDKYFDTFIKSVITALSILLVSGIWYNIKIMITIDERLSKIENKVEDMKQKSDEVYYYYLRHREPDF